MYKIRFGICRLVILLFVCAIIHSVVFMYEKLDVKTYKVENVVETDEKKELEQVSSQKEETKKEEKKEEEKEEEEKILNVEETKSASFAQTIYSRTNDVLLNPGKGFVRYGDNTSSKYDDLITVGYERYNWSDIEPEEGKYNWDCIDSAIRRYAARGKKFAFGIMNANTSSGKYVTPEWVFASGAKGREIDVEFWQDGLRKKQVIPEWNDPVFLQKMHNFVRALGARYDRNPNVLFVDIRSYGNWGEQHLGEIGGTYITPEELKQNHIIPYMQAFKNTLLVNPWGNPMYNGVYKWAARNGVSLRRDGIFKWSSGEECAIASPYVPTIFEYTASYDWMLSQGVFSEDALLQYMRNGRATYMQLDTKMYKARPEFVKKIANKLGYHFVLEKAEYLKDTNGEILVKLHILNDGVAKIYGGCIVYLALLDESYNVVEKVKTNIDVHTWMPESRKVEEFSVTFQAKGSYTLAIGMQEYPSLVNPNYKLGNNNYLKNNWYKIGEVNIQ